MYTMLAYAGSVNPAGIYTPLTPIPDTLYRVNANAFTVPINYNKLIGAFVFTGAGGAQARLVAPSLREIGLEMIAPVHLAISPTGEHFHTISPNRVIEFIPGEDLELQENSTPGGAEQHTGIILLADQEVAPVKGKIRSVGFTLTVAQAILGWTAAVPVFDDDLPVAKYDIVGMRLEAAGMVAARFSVPLSWNRPGIIPSASPGINNENLFRFGNMGVMASFDLNTALNIEVLGSAVVAAAAYRGVMDLIKKAA
jgi:hypothetical protein